ncbi:hypothetical protein C9I94_10485 [Photobacterium swingsii]|uniref:Relaxase n=1 Tax=Photobacterium swingsii TaxID=680026 RepID=A0A2T3P717_9GAMM|nr:relaxase/mobilization nuclease domain-containing protein [Photobacterium swingsii]PSW24458.1 hypothetical protein C9I94_10485 [Photobacterium swingsii]
MIVKFFKGDHSSAQNGLKYLEGGTKRRSVAPQLLSGNPEITREWLKQASRFSKAFTYGCLSFEEVDIPAHQKQQLMVSFEHTLMSGLTSQQYDIVWIEHRDKGRLELNFHIVNMELTTGKALTPYVHRRDMTRIDAWKCIANDTFGFTDPNDPSRARTFTSGNNSKSRRELMAQIDAYLFELAANGILNQQQDVIDALNKIDGVTVTRNTKSSISFKADGYQKPIRLKGELYGKSYTGIEISTAKQAERTASFACQHHERLKSNKQKLKERNEHIACHRRKLYRPTPSKSTPSQLAVSNVPEPSNIACGNNLRKIPDTGIRNHAISTLSSNRKIKREPKTLVLPVNKTFEKKDKNKINQYANNHTNQLKSSSTWVFKVLTKLRDTIKTLAGSINRRKAEARGFGDIYQETQCNCRDLNRLLELTGKWRLELKHQRAFKQLKQVCIVSPTKRMGSQFEQKI